MFESSASVFESSASVFELSGFECLLMCVFVCMYT